MYLDLRKNDQKAEPGGVTEIKQNNGQPTWARGEEMLQGFGVKRFRDQ